MKYSIVENVPTPCGIILKLWVPSGYQWVSKRGMKQVSIGSKKDIKAIKDVKESKGCERTTRMQKESRSGGGGLCM